MNNYKLIQGDCIEEMQKLIEKGVKVDMVLTDPPYGTTACKWDSVIPFEHMWKCLNGLTYDNTPIVLFGSEPFSSNLRMSNIYNYRYDWIWHKNTSGGFVNAKKMPMKYHEIISIFYKKQPTYNPQFQEYKDSIKQRFKNDGRVNRSKQIENSTNQIQDGLKGVECEVKLDRGKYPESVQYFKSVHNANGTRLHPTQKPVKLLEYLIKTYTNKGDTILDFTMGSGSTGVACMNTNRNFIGIEIDDKYYKIANDRLNKANEQNTLL